MKNSVEERALNIAVKIMVADGLCRYESATLCRRVYSDDATCENCIKSWLITKAKRELKIESRKEECDGRDHKSN